MKKQQQTHVRDEIENKHCRETGLLEAYRAHILCGKTCAPGRFVGLPMGFANDWTLAIRFPAGEVPVCPEHGVCIGYQFMCVFVPTSNHLTDPDIHDLCWGVFCSIGLFASHVHWARQCWSGVKGIRINCVVVSPAFYIGARDISVMLHFPVVGLQ